MLESITFKNFTAFPDSDSKFAQGLNVIVGESGTGKTHVLKAAYSAIYSCVRGNRGSSSANPTKARLQTTMANKLNAVFKPDELGGLARRERRGRQRCHVSCLFSPPTKHLEFSFNAVSKSEVTVDKVPSAWLDKLPVYLPTHELLTIYPGFVSLYETTCLPIEETWRDTCI